MSDPIAWLHDAQPDAEYAAYAVCAKGDPGCFPVFTGPQERGHGATSGSHHNTSTSVRELEWEHVTDWHEGVIEPFFEMVARTPFRDYQVIQQEEGGPCHASVGEYGTECRTLEEARAACQSDFQKRFNECLEPTNCEPKASGWRDIESEPPRDEQECLFLQGSFCFQGHWVADAKHTVACGAPYGESVTDATHWQPLPPPPGEEDNIDTVEGIDTIQRICRAMRWAKQNPDHGCNNDYHAARAALKAVNGWEPPTDVAEGLRTALSPKENEDG